MPASFELSCVSLPHTSYLIYVIHTTTQLHHYNKYNSPTQALGLPLPEFAVHHDDKETYPLPTKSSIRLPIKIKLPLMMPGRQDAFTVSIPSSPPPPQSISSYSRFIHDHTKRQMQAFGAMTSSSSSATRSSSIGTSMTNGAAPTMLSSA
ncbi:hypothetical protein TARUN_2307 [Trichoderma arundinaceum]|uniref:Uncharacterized protein n=1 Tax=Trichoderma arundinaceum TaxID=490622 RepID=A0A395NWQ4_TRIAR|nr:hypothetical protein TARUN_2307 [Trichoderma arundinaceum]